MFSWFRRLKIKIVTYFLLRRYFKRKLKSDPELKFRDMIDGVELTDTQLGEVKQVSKSELNWDDILNSEELEKRIQAIRKNG